MILFVFVAKMLVENSIQKLHEWKNTDKYFSSLSFISKGKTWSVLHMEILSKDFLRLYLELFYINRKDMIDK